MTTRFPLLAASAATIVLLIAGAANAADDIPAAETAPASYP